MKTAKTAVQSVKGIAKIENAYHQLRWLILDYGVPVCIPGPEAYLVRDYATAKFRELFNRYPYSDARITSAYTNDMPAIRDDCRSIPGQFVILELAVIRGAVQEDHIWKPPFNAGVCTWRLDGDGKDWRRNDFSDLTIAQVLPVTTDAGETIEPDTICPLRAEDVKTCECEQVTESYIDHWNGKSLFVSSHIPDSRKTGEKKYPLVVSISGGGGLRTVENGHDSAGGHFTRDRAACAWFGADEPVAVLNPQISTDDREDLPETMDRICDLTRRFIDTYPIDRDRVYCIGSSYGTLSWSTALSRPEYARMFTGYIQCNGHFAGAATMFRDEYDIRRAENILSPLTHGFTDFSSPDLRKHGSAFFDSGDFLEMKKALQPVVDARVFVDIWHGANDEVAPVLRGVTTFLILQEMYRQEGLSDTAIQELVRLTIIPTQTYHNLGIFSYHQASKVAVSSPDTLRHLLRKRKSELLRIR